MSVTKCPAYGKEVLLDAIVCHDCGCAIKNPSEKASGGINPGNRDHLGRYILGFLILGVVYLLVNFCSG